jgi:hypothetical protein
MGRALLTLCAALLLAACGAEEHATITDGDTPPAHMRADDPHGALPCTACHTGGLPGTRIAAVPPTTCAAAGCHAEAGPTHVSTATATFRHREHGADGEIAVSCAGCHTHAAGREPLRVSVDGCALCHLSNVAGQQPDDCRACHQQPRHVALTSQALPIPHSALPWVETGCTRCHFDVAEPVTRVSTARCASCHGRDQAIVARGIGTDLHPTHTAVTCTSCHESGLHRVRAMSSAVLLVCGDCHTREHNVVLGTEWNDDATCSSCHQAVHQPQQRLLLGMLPGAQAAPSSKFIAGITCRSCHIQPTAADPAGAAIRGQAEACSGCHRTEYRQVLDWWLAGTRERTRSVTAYVARARQELGPAAPDSAQQLLAGAEAMLRMVAEAGGHHNLEVSDRIFRESVDRVRIAYGLLRRVPPQPPVLGSPAHEGTCSYCHYSPDSPWDFRRMNDAFHRSVMGID